MTKPILQGKHSPTAHSFALQSLVRRQPGCLLHYSRFRLHYAVTAHDRSPDLQTLQPTVRGNAYHTPGPPSPASQQQRCVRSAWLIHDPRPWTLRLRWRTNFALLASVHWRTMALACPRALSPPSAKAVNQGLVTRQIGEGRLVPPTLHSSRNPIHTAVRQGHLNPALTGVY